MINKTEENNMNEITIDNEIYVKKSTIKSNNQESYYIFRTYSSGVWFGKLEEKLNSVGHFICKINNARRMWKWNGALSLGTIAEKGICESKLDDCRFEPIMSHSVELPNVIEILECKDVAIKQILEKDWDRAGRDD